jgi:hypothetical protein
LYFVAFSWEKIDEEVDVVFSEPRACDQQFGCVRQFGDYRGDVQFGTSRRDEQLGLVRVDQQWSDGR